MRPVNNPSRRLPAASNWNCEVTFTPFRRNSTCCTFRLFDSSTSTSASPPLMRSARFDSVRIWTLSATAAPAVNMSAAVKKIRMVSPLVVTVEIVVTVKVEVLPGPAPDVRRLRLLDGAHRVGLEDVTVLEIVLGHAHHLAQVLAVAAIERVEGRDVERQVITPARAGAAACTLADVARGRHLHLREADTAQRHFVLIARDQRAAVGAERSDLHERRRGRLLAVADPAHHVVDGRVDHIVVRDAAAYIGHGAGR